MLSHVCVSFLFQAEDGIRDAQESRGLGDVYKRQVVVAAAEIDGVAAAAEIDRADDARARQQRQGVGAAGEVESRRTSANDAAIGPVSYTHLTLPTIYSV